MEMKMKIILTVPEDVTKVTIPNHFNSVIEKNTFHNNITEIIFSSNSFFNQKLENLPESSNFNFWK